jgi:LysM repeat protein/ABC-type branched-subunit amino acid transport system substrate-binding protein
MTLVQSRQQPLNGNKMKHLYYIFFVVLAFAKADTLTAQNYQQHTVDKGETVTSISEKYNVATSELLALNPDAKNGIKLGAILLIPADSKLLTQRKIATYKTHKVKRKETLYTLAKEYGVTILDIKEANKQLYNTSLNRGSEIRIPVFEKLQTATQIVASKELPIMAKDTTRNDVVEGKHLVKEKEGLFRIAIQYKTTIDNLKKMNPDLGGLKPGMLINVPIIAQEETSDLLDYQVPSKMGMYSLTRMTGLSKDSLISLNPELKDGLKAGMTIKIPNNIATNSSVLFTEDYATVDLLDSINNYRPQRMAVMLPLSLHKVNEGFENRDQLLEDKTARIAVDFLSGMQVARDSALTLGLQVEYDVYDTQKSKDKTLSILNSNDFTIYNSVIGPLMSSNVVEVAKQLRSDDIPVISPLTNTDVRLYKNLFQSRPDDQLLKDRLKEFLKYYAVGKNVIIVTDNTKPELRREFSNLFPQANILVPNSKKNYIYSLSYIKALKPEVENVIILAVDNVGFITDAVTNYAAKTDSHKITMFGMESFEEMDLPNARLSLLHYTFPQMHKDADEKHSFIKRYELKYGITPNKYVTRGFDIAMDVILRQASSGTMFESATKRSATRMSESKFAYHKKPSEGYNNEAIYILQYQEDMSIQEIVSIPKPFKE